MSCSFRSRLPTFALPFSAFLVTTAYLPAIAGFAVTPRWAVLALMLPLLLCFTRINLTIGHLYGIAFLLYATASSAWTTVPLDALDELAKLLILATAFCLGSETEDIDHVYLWFAAGICVSAAVASAQFAGLQPVEVIHGLTGRSGLFGNKNFLGEAAALALVGALPLLGDRPKDPWRWVLYLGCAVALALANCRGAWLGLALAGIVWLWPRHRLAAVAAVVAALIVLRVALGISVNGSSYQRLAIWLDAWDGLTLWGRGAGQLYATLPEHGPRLISQLTRTAHAHSDILEAIYDYGIGAIILLAIFAFALAGPHQPKDERSRLVLVAFIGAGLVGFPLHQPATAFLAALVAGHLCGQRRRLCLYELGRGGGGLAWHAHGILPQDRRHLAPFGFSAVPDESVPPPAAGLGGHGIR